MKKILNVGCGNDTYGTDFVDLYPSRPKVKKCDFDKDRLPYKSNMFDEVFCKGVIEHVRNPSSLIEEMKRVLRKNGKLIIITDNAHFLGFHIKGSMHTGGYEKHGRIGGGSGSKDRHYALYTTNHIKNHLEVAGMKNIKIKYETFAYRKVKFNAVNLLIYLLSKISKKLGSTMIVAESTKT
jgi:ubiquinone/menaquinone biosynthesis C-methylase UbiE